MITRPSFSWSCNNLVFSLQRSLIPLLPRIWVEVCLLPSELPRTGCPAPSVNRWPIMTWSTSDQSDHEHCQQLKEVNRWSNGWMDEWTTNSSRDEPLNLPVSKCWFCRRSTRPWRSTTAVWPPTTRPRLLSSLSWQGVYNLDHKDISNPILTAKIFPWQRYFQLNPVFSLCYFSGSPGDIRTKWTILQLENFLHQYLLIFHTSGDVRKLTILQLEKIQPFCTIISKYSTHYCYLLGKTLWSVFALRI